MKNKGIVFVCQYLAKGGAERVLSILIEHYSKITDVTVVLLYENSIDYPIPSTVNLIQLKWDKNTSIINQLRGIHYLRKVSHGKVVISFLYSAIRNAVLVSLLNKTHLIVSERNDPSKDPIGVHRRILRNILFHFADQIVFQTEDQKQYFSRTIRKKGVIIENPISPCLPDLRDLSSKVIISVCRYDPQKNIKMSIDAFSEFYKTHKEYSYDIYGKGELETELRKYIKSLSLDNVIKLRGFSTDIHSIMSRASMYISSSDYEGISNSMLEALGIGLPTICTDCPIGGARHIIKNGHNGILVKVGDTADLAIQMNRIADDKVYAKFLSDNAVKIRDDYSIEKICSKWDEAIYKHVMNRLERL